MKPWPADAVMIVAADAGKEIRANMETPTAAVCRDCGRALIACSYTIRTAQGLPTRRGRPVMFFCFDCHLNYDVNTITHTHDHAGVTGRLIP